MSYLTIKDTTFSKFNTKNVMSFKVQLEEEDEIEVQYIGRTSSTECIISDEDNAKLQAFLKKNLKINALEYFNLFSVNAEVKIGSFQKNIIVPNEINFIKLFQSSLRAVEFSFQEMLFNRINSVKTLIRSFSYEYKNELQYSMPKKKSEPSTYNVKLIFKSNLPYIQIKKDNEQIYSEKFSYDSFKYFCKSHFGVILARKEKGILSLSKASYKRSDINIALLDRIEENDTTSKDCFEENFYKDISAIFESIEEIFLLLSKKEHISNREFDLDL